jgi:alpha-beta hydrolase superfamily lysophospholipase
VEAARERYAALCARYGRVAVLGFSMGGAVASFLAAERDPDRLVLVAPFFGVTYRWYYVLPAKAWNALLSPFVPWVESPVKLAAVNRPGGEDDFTTYRAFPRDATRLLHDLRLMVWHHAGGGPVPARITCPTLVVYAPGDVASSPERIRQFQQALAAESVTVVQCNRSNHHILHDYDRGQAIEAITEFLQ